MNNLGTQGINRPNLSDCWKTHKAKHDGYDPLRQTIFEFGSLEKKWEGCKILFHIFRQMKEFSLSETIVPSHQDSV